jgi:hypothetical protein
MARTRKSDKQPLQDEQAADTPAMLMELPAGETESVWVWELEE